MDDVNIDKPIEEYEYHIVALEDHECERDHPDVICEHEKGDIISGCQVDPTNLLGSGGLTHVDAVVQYHDGIDVAVVHAHRN